MGKYEVIISILLLLIILLTGCFSNSSDNDYDEVDLSPFNQINLISPFQFTAINETYGAFKYMKADTLSVCVFYLDNLNKVLSFESRMFARQLFFDNETSCLLMTSRYSESHVYEFTVYDKNGNKGASINSTGIIKPSSSGKYFYTASILDDSPKQQIYDNKFNLIKEFGRGSHWDAFISGDSIYVLMKGNEIHVYSLPEFELLNTYNFGFHIYGVQGSNYYIDESSSICGIFGEFNIGIVNLKTSEIIRFKPERKKFGKPVFTLNGNLGYLVGFDREVGLVIDEFIIEDSINYTKNEYVISFEDIPVGYMPAGFYETFTNISSTPDYLILNYSAYNREDDLGRRLASVIIKTPLSKENIKKAWWSLGPVWVNTNGTTIYHIPLDSTFHMQPPPIVLVH